MTAADPNWEADGWAGTVRQDFEQGVDDGLPVHRIIERMLIKYFPPNERERLIGALGAALDSYCSATKRAEDVDGFDFSIAPSRADEDEQPATPPWTSVSRLTD